MIFWAEKHSGIKKGHPQKQVFERVIAALQINIEQFTLGKKAFDQGMI
jgi:hypothetical protein